MTKIQILKILIGNRTQKEFALKHGKGANQVSEWLTKKRHISDAMLREIANKEGYKLNINYKLQKL